MSVSIIEASSKAAHSASIIFSHGLGDSAQGWIPLGRELKSRFPHVKWIFPTAPMQPVTLNGGMKMNSWYDIRTLTPPSATAVDNSQDEAGMMKSVAILESLVEKEIAGGIKSERIIVGGFSQGAVISLLAGITSSKKLGGLVSLSGYLGLSNKIDSIKSAHSTSTPIFWGHGKVDQTVRYVWGVQSKDKLVEVGFDKIEFHSYPHMAHSLCEEEQSDLEAFLKKILPQ